MDELRTFADIKKWVEDNPTSTGYYKVPEESLRAMIEFGEHLDAQLAETEKGLKEEKDLEAELIKAIHELKGSLVLAREQTASMRETISKLWEYAAELRAEWSWKRHSTPKNDREMERLDRDIEVAQSFLGLEEKK